MTYDFLFTASNTLAITGWVLLLFLPKWIWTQRLISAVIIPVLLGGIYLYLFMAHRATVQGSFQSLEELQILMENPGFLIAGWVHWLSFDLFIGAWQVRDADRLGIQHWHIIPCLIFTGLYGPLGLLIYFTIRFVMTGSLLVGRPKEDEDDDLFNP